MWLIALINSFILFNNYILVSGHSHVLEHSTMNITNNDTFGRSETKQVYLTVPSLQDLLSENEFSG